MTLIGPQAIYLVIWSWFEGWSHLTYFGPQKPDQSSMHFNSRSFILPAEKIWQCFVAGFKIAKNSAQQSLQHFQPFHQIYSSQSGETIIRCIRQIFVCTFFLQKFPAVQTSEVPSCWSSNFWSHFKRVYSNRSQSNYFYFCVAIKLWRQGMTNTTTMKKNRIKYER